MTEPDADWEARLSAHWSRLDATEPSDFAPLSMLLSPSCRQATRSASSSVLPRGTRPAILGDPAQAVTLLTRELDAGRDELDGAVRAFLALALVDVGREREAVAVGLTALASYLPRYNRSLARYAQALIEPRREPDDEP